MFKETLSFAQLVIHEKYIFIEFLMTQQTSNKAKPITSSGCLDYFFVCLILLNDRNIGKFCYLDALYHFSSRLTDGFGECYFLTFLETLEKIDVK